MKTLLAALFGLAIAISNARTAPAPDLSAALQILRAVGPEGAGG